MTRYVAFLRAINVGGRTVRMAELRAHVSAAGFADVETFIASGNVIFRATTADTAALGRRIEAALQRALGYAVPAFVRSMDEIRGIAAHRPFDRVPSSRADGTVYVILMAKPPARAAARKLLAASTDDDVFAVRGREIYWLRRGSLLESPFTAAQWERIIGGPATARNRNTIVRLAARYES